ncbi:P-selectin glycoprotein ligand 1 [Tamandua tetradactyla]|uniref:P-selectin glycoprotein ligand 1 n=1 Tax=Tamandua tetradactyla TaxID=48850 RepID=UPI0040541190
MPLQALLLLSLLGPGSSLPLLRTTELQPDLNQTELSQTQDFDEEDDYPLQNTDPPEMLENSTWALLSSEPLAGMGTLGQRVSVWPGTPEPATVETATRASAGLGTLRREPITQGTAVTQDSLITEGATLIFPITEAPATEAPSTEPPATEALSTNPPATEAPSTEPPATEALSTEPPATEAPSTGPAVTEALSTEPPATEAPSTEPPATVALSTEPPAMEAPSTEPPATEALSTEPPAMEVPSTEPAATEISSMEPTATVALSTESATTEAPSTEPVTTRGPAMVLPVTSDPHNETTVAASNPSMVFINQRENRQGLSPGSSVVPDPTGFPARVAVRQCLLGILILAVVATVFLVCTVVLAVRLSRRNHTYPVRGYSPTEMVCISSLLPDGADAPAAANGAPPGAKTQTPTPAPRRDRDGDDLTLQSFLP